MILQISYYFHHKFTNIFHKVFNDKYVKFPSANVRFPSDMGSPQRFYSSKDIIFLVIVALVLLLWVAEEFLS